MARDNNAWIKDRYRPVGPEGPLLFEDPSCMTVETIDVFLYLWKDREDSGKRPLMFIIPKDHGTEEPAPKKTQKGKKKAYVEVDDDDEGEESGEEGKEAPEGSKPDRRHKNGRGGEKSESKGASDQSNKPHVDVASPEKTATPLRQKGPDTRTSNMTAGQEKEDVVDNDGEIEDNSPASIKHNPDERTRFLESLSGHIWYKDILSLRNKCKVNPLLKSEKPLLTLTKPSPQALTTLH